MVVASEHEGWIYIEFKLDDVGGQASLGAKTNMEGRKKHSHRLLTLTSQEPGLILTLELSM